MLQTDLALAGTDGVAYPQGSSLKFYRFPRISPPPGWTVDAKSGQHYAMLAFAPNGKNFNSSESVMYARAIHEPKQKSSLEKHIADDIADFKSRDPKAVGAIKEPILDQDSKKWAVVDFVYSDGTTTNFESVAYLDERDYRFHLALSTRSKSAFETLRPAFVAWVRSYRDIPDTEQSREAGARPTEPQAK